MEVVQAKREPSRGITTTTLTHFVWRCILMLLESFLTYFAPVSWNQSRFRVIASLSLALVSVHTITCNLHLYWLTPWSNVAFEDHLINKLYPHFVETESLLASKQRDCRLPSLFLEFSMQSWETTISLYVQSFALWRNWLSGDRSICSALHLNELFVENKTSWKLTSKIIKYGWKYVWLKIVI